MVHSPYHLWHLSILAGQYCTKAFGPLSSSPELFLCAASSCLTFSWLPLGSMDDADWALILRSVDSAHQAPCSSVTLANSHSQEGSYWAPNLRTIVNMFPSFFFFQTGSSVWLKQALNYQSICFCILSIFKVWEEILTTSPSWLEQF